MSHNLTLHLKTKHGTEIKVPLWQFSSNMTMKALNSEDPLEHYISLVYMRTMNNIHAFSTNYNGSIPLKDAIEKIWHYSDEAVKEKLKIESYRDDPDIELEWSWE